MKADRELLELAAKACGYDTSHIWNAARLTMPSPVIGLCIDGVGTNWNPLDNDGHAFRLMVKLSIKVKWNAVLNQALAWDGITETAVNGEDYGGADSATRRAIVLVAAQKVMEL